MCDVVGRVDARTDGGVDPVQRIETAVNDVAGEARDRWTSHVLSERGTELVMLRERLDAELLRVTGEWDRHRGWEADGSLSAAAWSEHRAPLAPNDARRLVKAARLVDCRGPIRNALADGAMTAPQVAAMARVVSTDRVPLLFDHVEVLVDQARVLPVRDFATLMRR